MREMHRRLPAGLRRPVVTLLGGLLLATGLVLLVLPGPGLLVIPAGLGVLALEYESPRRWLAELRSRLKR